METEAPSEREQSRSILFRPVGEGIPIAFFTLLVKMAPLHRACNGDLAGFFKETGDAWDMDGRLCSAAAMSLDDLNQSLGLLKALGLQCHRAPVDFYVLEAFPFLPQGPGGSIFWTIDDGELRFTTDGWKSYAHLNVSSDTGRPS
jgi:hypothetical protein